MKTVFLQPVRSHVRYQKRIKAFIQNEMDVKVLTFEREYYSGKTILNEYESLGVMKHRHYFGRILLIIKSLYKVRRFIKKADIVYAFGLDMLLLAYLARSGLRKKVKLIYEVGDIRGILCKNNLLSQVLRALERYLLNRVQLLVVTSKAFITGYYIGVQGLKDIRYHVIENKLDPETLPTIKDSDCSKGVIRIGYFGVLRCNHSWEILKKLGKLGKDRIYIYLRGIVMGIDNLEEEVSKLPNIDYCGEYVVPDDLPDLYSKVDIIWACGPYRGNSDGNWKWARANRFYESCYFRKPMVTQMGTEDGKVVEELGLGINLDLSNPEKVIKKILDIKKTDIMGWQKNISQLPSNIYMYTDEHHRLINQIGIQEFTHE